CQAYLWQFVRPQSDSEVLTTYFTLLQPSFLQRCLQYKMQAKRKRRFLFCDIIISVLGDSDFENLKIPFRFLKKCIPVSEEIRNGEVAKWFATCDKFDLLSYFCI
ncbi:hypothetical protein BHM03_00018991, partial [Ensete ventricosum]